MKTSTSTLACLAIITALTGCASSGAPQVAEAAPVKTCAASLGSHICREEGSGSMSNVKTISGDELKRGPGAGSGSVQGNIGN